MITTYNTAETDTACKILCKKWHKKKPSVTRDILDLFDEIRDLKNRQFKEEGAKEYRKADKRAQKALKKAKERYSVL